MRRSDRNREWRCLTCLSAAVIFSSVNSYLFSLQGALGSPQQEKRGDDSQQIHFRLMKRYKNNNNNPFDTDPWQACCGRAAPKEPPEGNRAPPPTIPPTHQKVGIPPLNHRNSGDTVRENKKKNGTGSGNSTKPTLPPFPLPGRFLNVPFRFNFIPVRARSGLVGTCANVEREPSPPWHPQQSARCCPRRPARVPT